MSLEVWGGGLEGFAGDCADLSLTRVQVELSVGRTVKPQTTQPLANETSCLFQMWPS